MVGWRPLNSALRKDKIGEFLQRITNAQEFSEREVPLILQYSDGLGDLRPWAWFVSRL